MKKLKKNKNVHKRAYWRLTMIQKLKYVFNKYTKRKNCSKSEMLIDEGQTKF